MLSRYQYINLVLYSYADITLLRIVSTVFQNVNDLRKKVGALQYCGLKLQQIVKQDK